MTERTPVGGAFRFAYGRIASPDNNVRIGGALIPQIEAEYTAGFNGQGWGEPAVFLTDQQGALLVRELVFSGAGGGTPAVVWAFDLESPSQTLQFNSQNLAPPSAAVNYGFNGTATPETAPAFEQLRTQSPANAAANVKAGVLVATPPAQWSVIHAPAADTLATATRAAQGAGTVNIVTGATFTIAGLASSFGGLTCRVRNGAGGTILWESAIYHGAGQNSVTIDFDGRQIPCSDNTAAVAEFSAAPGDPTLFESVTLLGITV